VLIQFLPLWAQEISKSPGAPAVVYGVVLILLMFLLPGGVSGLLRRLGSLTSRGYHRSSS
jgi:branched-chain amino acid transport system permease protein